MENWILNLFGFLYMIISKVTSTQSWAFVHSRIKVFMFPGYGYNMITHHIIYILPGLKYIPIGLQIKHNIHMWLWSKYDKKI